MTKNTQYLIAFGCLLLALVMGVLGMVTEGNSWVYVAIPLGLLGMFFAVWTRTRKDS
ncbi:MAG: hypothetical protein PHU75_04765 [Candidatus Nanopelagicales bacterium]|nr:hypothetical protein [Candidatus Nanopelagicales bacterium]